VFGEPQVPPMSDGSGNDRKNLREAGRLLDEVGFAVKGGKRTNANGDVLDIEFLIVDVSSERILGPYVKNLNAIGIQTTIRRIDPAQYERRRKSYDYDVLTARFVVSLTPGQEVKNLWSSEAAKNEGSFNLAGIQSPAVDALIGKITEAKTRAELNVATRALDRVLRAGQYWVPQWFKAAHHIAHWDKFGRPATKPLYDRGIIDTWWHDPEKAAKVRTN
jgi:microcin C transport system substrate-binding protein